MTVWVPPPTCKGDVYGTNTGNACRGGSPPNGIGGWDVCSYCKRIFQIWALTALPE